MVHAAVNTRQVVIQTASHRIGHVQGNMDERELEKL